MWSSISWWQAAFVLQYLGALPLIRFRLPSGNQIDSR